MSVVVIHGAYRQEDGIYKRLVDATALLAYRPSIPAYGQEDRTDRRKVQLPRLIGPTISSNLSKCYIHGAYK
jgi:hypothetical protein